MKKYYDECRTWLKKHRNGARVSKDEMLVGELSFVVHRDCPKMFVDILFQIIREKAAEKVEEMRSGIPKQFTLEITAEEIRQAILEECFREDD